MSTGCKEKILSNDYSDWITDYELTPELIAADTGQEDYCYRQVDEELGLVFSKRTGEYPLGPINPSYRQIPALFGLQQAQVRVSGEPFDAGPLMASGILQVQRPPLNLTGKGIIIAFIDTGIDYRNPVFLKPDGTSRILAIWDQTLQEGEPPEGFFYGTEYRRDEINEALRAPDPFGVVPSRDENGHGTAMASVAAGSALREGSLFTGAAPEADILVVKLKECKPYLRDYYLLPEGVPAYQSTDLMMAIEYADQFARTFFQPVVFCIGVGSSYGSHSGTSPFSSYLNRIGRKRSRAVVIGGGNEGNTGHHYSGRLDPASGRLNPASDRLNPVGSEAEEGSKAASKDEIEIQVGEGQRGFLAGIWGKAPNRFSLSLRSPGGEEVSTVGFRLGETREFGFVYEPSRIRITFLLVEGGTGDELILLRFENPTPGIWTLVLVNESGLEDAAFHIWLPISSFLGGETYFLKPDPDLTLTIPAYAGDCITVASYYDKNNSIYVRSGRGFSRANEVKPDLAAPGVEISAVLRGLADEVRLGRVSGSSMSAAITAGGVAQFLEWLWKNQRVAYLRSNEVKNYLIRGAVRDSGLTYPNRQWGYGKLNLQGVFDSLAGV